MVRLSRTVRQQDKACPVRLMVLDVFAKDLAAIDLGCAAAADRRPRRVAALDRTADGTCRVVCFETNEMRIFGKEHLALPERGRMRLNGPDRINGRGRTGNQKLRHRHKYLCHDL